MAFNPKSVEKQTGTMSTLGKILTVIGITAVILGAFSLVMGIFADFVKPYGLEGVVKSVPLSFWGLVLSAGGATLHAIRSIAVNCARLADASRSSDQGAT